MIITVLRFIFLFIGVWFTIINTSKVCLRNSVPFANFFYQSIGITGFVITQWLL